ncbi:MAG: hypothetical protein BWK77_07190 [Verrucomicrobia bacterium A1]|nr:MAG: hypothetical protein BWK77_07190 [Verrucomicrobia bacterium A1]
MLQEEFEYYLKHQKELVAKYKGRVLVIRGQRVEGDYSTDLEALEAASKKFPLGSFLIQLCEPGSDSYTQTYHSRVAFARA